MADAEKLIKEKIAEFDNGNGATDEDKKNLMRSWQRGWVISRTLNGHPELSRLEVTETYDRLVPKAKP